MWPCLWWMPVYRPRFSKSAGAKALKTAVIGSAGFSESGPEGQKLQTQLSAIAKQYEIRVCGPNCHGAFNVIKGIPVGYDHSFALPLSAGPVAIASHSGALLGVLGHRALQAGQGLSYLVSNGNEMDLDLCDFVEFFLEDEHTKVVAVLMEGLKNGPRFLELARRSHELRKTIVVLKVGKSERGAITTLAHTARMAGSGEVYEAAFRQFGVISTDTVEAFLGAAQLAAHQPVPRGGRLFVMTSSGAGASLMADKASEYGIELADISEEAKGRIPQRRTAILTNPFDTAGASRSPGFLSAVCEAFAADTANDCLLMYHGPLAVRHEYARQFCCGGGEVRQDRRSNYQSLRAGDARYFPAASHSRFRRRDRRLLQDIARLHRLRPIRKGAGCQITGAKKFAGDESRSRRDS